VVPLSSIDETVAFDYDPDSVEDAVRQLVDLATKLPSGADADGVLVDLVVGSARCVVTTLAHHADHNIEAGGRVPGVLTGLSPREQEIARMVASGYTNKEIASVLEISTWTVSTHLRRIFSKLAVGTRAAMVARLFAGTLSPHPRRHAGEPTRPGM
jgi:DNA-binding CsgD family transcriptional regulator